MIRVTRLRTVWEPALYTMVGVGSVYVAVEHMPYAAITAWQKVFVYGWLAFAAIVISANLWFVLGVDKERSVKRSRRRHRSTVFQATAQTQALRKHTR